MEDFEALLKESFEIDTPEEGTVVKGRVIAIEAGQAIIDVGYKMEGRVDLKEFGSGETVAAGEGFADSGVRDVILRDGSTLRLRPAVVSIVAIADVKCLAMPSRKETSEPSSLLYRIPFQPPPSVSYVIPIAPFSDGQLSQ